MSEEMEKAFEADCDDSLTKPIELDLCLKKWDLKTLTKNANFIESL